MSGGGDDEGDKTVFRPSPLQELKNGNGFVPHGAPSSGFDPPPALSRAAAAPIGAGVAPSRLAEDDVPLPATPPAIRNIMLAEAEPVLALLAGVRAGRVRLPMPELHRQCALAIARFERAIQPHYPEEKRQRAKYAVCATADDIAQNLPGIGTDGAEWARRSMVVQFFHENIGGDRFWQLVDDMLRVPHDNLDLIELFHACLAAGFEGRFRVMPDGRRRLHEIMARLQGALPHVRSLSQIELVPNWRGENAPVGRIGWNVIALAGAAAAALLLLAYIVLRLMLGSSGEEPHNRLAGLLPDARLTLSRPAAAMPAPIRRSLSP